MPFELGDELLGMIPHSWGRCRFCLEHRLARIGFTTSRHVPTVQVQPRAEALHSLGPDDVLERLSQLLEARDGTAPLEVSRVAFFCG